MAQRIQIRRGTAAQWSAANTLLSAGELAFESDTNKLKVGDGVTSWNALPYLLGSGSVVTPPAGQAPTNSVLPAITGSAISGQTVSVSNGTWANSPTSFAYQWKRNGSNISGATSSTYLLAVADEIATVTCTVTATNATGSAAATSVGISVSAPAGEPTVTSTISAPVLVLAVGQTTYPPQFDIQLDQSAQIGDTIRLEWRSKAGAVVGFATNVIDDAEATAKAATFTGLSAISSGTYRYYARVIRGSLASAFSNLVVHGPDDIEPVLTGGTSNMTGATSGTVLFSTDKSDGTARTLVTTANVAPSQSAMDASTFTLSITSLGAKQIAVTGLTQTTLYYAWVQHTDALGNKSAITAAGSFTTDAAVSFSMVETAAPAPAQTSILNAYTWNDLPIGSPQSSRLVVALVHFSENGVIPTVTIGGITATRLGTGPGAGNISMHIALVPTGTTATVNVTSSNYTDKFAIRLFALIGASATPTAFVQGNGTFRGSPHGAAITTPAGGGTIAFVFTEGAGTLTVTGGTQSGSIQNYSGTDLRLTAVTRTTASSALIGVQTGSMNSAYLLASFAP